MNIHKMLKALSNEARLQILRWLKEPETHFLALAQASHCTTKEKAELKEIGVCVGLIQQKTNLSQSTVSEYLSLLEDAGLIQSQRIGQWTYYKRNEQGLKQLLKYLRDL